MAAPRPVRVPTDPWSFETMTLEQDAHNRPDVRHQLHCAVMAAQLTRFPGKTLETTVLPLGMQRVGMHHAGVRRSSWGCSQGGDIAVVVAGDAHPAAAHGAARAPRRQRLRVMRSI